MEHRPSRRSRPSTLFSPHDDDTAAVVHKLPANLSSPIKLAKWPRIMQSTAFEGNGFQHQVLKAFDLEIRLIKTSSRSPDNMEIVLQLIHVKINTINFKTSLDTKLFRTCEARKNPARSSSKESTSWSEKTSGRHYII